MEFLFGLIMVLTLTCTFHASGASRGSVRTRLMEALGWMIDAFFYLLNSLGQRGHGVALLGQLRRTSDPVEARSIVADELPPLVASLLEPHEIAVERELTQIPESTVWPRLAEEDRLGALGVFPLVFLSRFPVVVPFILVSNARFAMVILGVAMVGVAILLEG